MVGGKKQESNYYLIIFFFKLERKLSVAGLPTTARGGELCVQLGSVVSAA